MTRPTVAAVVLLLTAAVAASQEVPDALALYRDGRYQQAVTVTLAELQAEPDRRDAFTVLGWSLLALGRYQEAHQYALQGLQVARYDHRIIEIDAEALYHLGSLEASLARFEEYAALAPEGQRIELVYAFMGEIFILLQEYDNADIAFAAAVYLLPTRAAWWARLGYARELGGRAALAQGAYREALKLDPNLREATQGLARVSGPGA